MKKITIVTLVFFVTLLISGCSGVTIKDYEMDEIYDCIDDIILTMSDSTCEESFKEDHLEPYAEHLGSYITEDNLDLEIELGYVQPEGIYVRLVVSGLEDKKLSDVDVYEAISNKIFEDFSNKFLEETDLGYSIYVEFNGNSNNDYVLTFVHRNDTRSVNYMVKNRPDFEDLNSEMKYVNHFDQETYTHMSLDVKDDLDYGFRLLLHTDEKTFLLVASRIEDVSRDDLISIINDVFTDYTQAE